MTGIGVVSGVECIIAANDPTVLGGAITPISIKKTDRALEISRLNRLPYVQFVESAGADLRRGEDSVEAEMRRSAGPLRGERAALPRHHGAFGGEDPDGVAGLRQLDGRRRLPAGHVGLQHLRARDVPRCSWAARRW